jgi:dihydroorotate dehydrogenase electron transfer subunit
LIEDAELISQQVLADGQRVIHLKSPRIAAQAKAGSFVHLTCSNAHPMRRPLSIQRVDRAQGLIEVLYKIVGLGTHALSERKVGETLSCMGPIGNGFSIDLTHTRPLLIGGGVGIPPMIFLSDEMKQLASLTPFVILGSEIPFPFNARPSTIVVPGIPSDVIAAHPLLEDWNIPSRLTSLKGFAGCYEGYVTQLASIWLKSLSDAERAKVIIYSCGPTPMLKAVAQLAEAFKLPAQVSLEEFMACAVGGCAGCVVKINTENGPKMQRVCVDGPVFEASRVMWTE